MSRSFLRIATLALFFGSSAGVAGAATLDDVKARGSLVCGVNEGLFGFSAQDDAGVWTGFDADFCRAVAAAIFDDADKVEFVPMPLADRFTSLRDGEIDILSRNSTWTMGRETEFGLTFAGVTYYDGQGFMLPRSAEILSALELDGSTVCVLAGTTTEANLADYFGANNMSYEAIVTTSAAESLAAYEDGTCNVMTSDISQLYAARFQLDDSAEHVILAEAISKEPLGPVVREDDPKWATLVKWVHFALINAEELGVFSYNIDQALASKKPEVRRLVGLEGDFGEQLGLTNGWVVSMLRTVGNYGEIFDRSLGFGSELHIPRGMNQLWHLGGIQYAPPIR
jgi:general L-amino acid transport system substrate-binding protein